jgi:hypothetical protein
MMILKFTPVMLGGSDTVIGNLKYGEGKNKETAGYC